MNRNRHGLGPKRAGPSNAPLRQLAYMAPQKIGHCANLLEPAIPARTNKIRQQPPHSLDELQTEIPTNPRAVGEYALHLHRFVSSRCTGASRVVAGKFPRLDELPSYFPEFKGQPCAMGLPLGTATRPDFRDESVPLPAPNAVLLLRPRIQSSAAACPR